MKTSTVADVMTPRVIAAHEDAGYKQIVEVMRANRVSALPVVDSHNRVLGVVSEADLLIKEAEGAPQRASWRWLLPSTERKGGAVLAKDLMTRPAVTIGREATVAEAAGLMSARRIKRLPVVDEAGHLMGVVSRVDVLSVYGREDSEIRDEIIHSIIAGDFTLDPAVFEVQVRAGIVTITGQAESKDVASQLLDAIRHVEGVVQVRDRLSRPHEDPAGKAKTFAFNTFTPKG
jgi:CBS-domain-containing membrane protein